MNRTYAPTQHPLPPVVLGVDLTIAHNEGLRRSLRSAFGVSTRAINLRIDPGMDLIFLCEATLSSSLPCLAAITASNVMAVRLREAQLTWNPDPDHAIGRGTPTLGALESGSCFLMANSRKVPIASFSPRNVHPTHVDMELQGQLNLLEFLRADNFTVEVSGTNRRRLTRPLTFSVVLSFEIQQTPKAHA
ncbi:hypothetical protein SAMN06265337_1758 [Hymenobacter gelipurpurascens]|uniref:Uncharacterized protein n=1 Tax=Hymenobacter gelipurpurascens TaxID=89968 RepID=A0A212TM14_9BACT|nr:hypothetical protein [Hymenobacter gelipurpurascens]SNC66874.1 hypothetical protein SAMN06265337_1758 [Hymenobacter gelipurpurascens]